MNRCLCVAATVTILTSAALWPASPAFSQVELVQFCRDASQSICIGSTSVFSTTDTAVWILFSVSGEGPYDIKIEWIAPNGSTYWTHTGTATGGGPWVWRASLAIQGRRAETLPGEWTVRVLLNNRQVVQQKFALRLAGDPKFWVPSLGVVVVGKAVTARGVESDMPTDETIEFKLTDSVYAYVRLTFSSRFVTRRLTATWKWISPSGETLEENRQLAQLRANETMLALSGKLPSIEGKVQQPAGNWQVELALDGVTVAKLRFSLAPE